METKWKKQKKWKKLERDDGQYVIMNHSKIESQAWKKLSGTSIKLYIKMATFNHIGNVTFTYKQASEYCGISAKTFKRCIDEMCRLGFIDILSSRHYRKPNLYAFSTRWKLYGNKAYLDKYESRGNDFFDTEDLDMEKGNNWLNFGKKEI